MYSFDIIFLIDDDPINNLINKRLIGKLALSDSIVEFLEVEHAIDALRCTGQEKKILIFLDINMPVKNGWDFLTYYKTHFAHRKDTIVMLSSSIDFQDRQKAKQFSIVDGYLEKPLTHEKIHEILN
ncbi:response regulator [Pararhodonellum marinum]|uniref:response regulator n=1 Tax=Pararhodonellum marinum TaxID=2755358 RepID=UPI00188E96AF|nr:response regulator [Pararhodonellum marinum]